MKFSTIIILTLLCCGICNKGNATEPQWIEKKVIITAWGNDELFLNGSIIAYVADEKGEANPHGLFLQIINCGRYSCFFHSASNSRYVDKNYPTIELSPGHAFLYHDEIKPGVRRLVNMTDGGVYMTQEEKKKEIICRVYFKYVKEATANTAAENEWRKLKAENPSPKIQRYAFFHLSVLKSGKNILLYSTPLEIKTPKKDFSEEEMSFLQTAAKQFPEYRTNIEQVIEEYLSPTSTEHNAYISLGTPDVPVYNNVTDCLRGIQSSKNETLETYRNLDETATLLTVDLESH